jgi:hypothetical protein
MRLTTPYQPAVPEPVSGRAKVAFMSFFRVDNLAVHRTQYRLSRAFDPWMWNPLRLSLEPVRSANISAQVSILWCRSACQCWGLKISVTITQKLSSAHSRIPAALCPSHVPGHLLSQTSANLPASPAIEGMNFSTLTSSCCGCE